MSQSREELLSFLDYLTEKGLANRSTAQSRKAAVNKVLGILSNEEAADISKLDLDQVMSRFMNLEGANYKPDSLLVYKSRVKAAIDDFLAYRDNPMTFRASSGNNSKQRKSGTTQRKPQQPHAKDEHSPIYQAPNISASRITMAENILPIPLRENLLVRIQGLPYDLTNAEANKIANVVKAMATDNEF